LSKVDKIIKKLQKKPTPKDFKWEELIKILKHFGFVVVPSTKTGGSRRKFINDGKVIISLHEPHSSNELKKYQIDQILEVLKKEEFL